MLRKFPILLLAGIFIMACHQKNESALKQPLVNEQASSFFPVTQFILGQLSELDSVQVAPLKITTENGKADSTWMKRNEIRLFAEPFLTPVIDSIRWHSYFSERSFLDQTINAFTFSYDPIHPLPDSIELKRWDVYVDPDNNRVKRIFMIKQVNKDNAQQTTQLTWKTGYFCKITTITEKAARKPQIKEEQLIWNFGE